MSWCDNPNNCNICNIYIDHFHKVDNNIYTDDYINSKYFNIKNNIIGDLYPELSQYYDDNDKKSFFKLYLVKDVKDGYYCIECIRQMIYSNDIEIDYVNPWLAYLPLPTKNEICKYYKLNYWKYKPLDIKPENRLTRKNGYVIHHFFKYPSLNTLEPFNFNDNDRDELILYYNKLKSNPKLFGNLSKVVIDNLKPLDYYLNKFDIEHQKLLEYISEFQKVLPYITISTVKY